MDATRSAGAQESTAMNRMFQVIVVGGLSLTGYACGRGVVVAEGSGAGGASSSEGFGHSAESSAVGTTVVGSGGAGSGAGGFPAETGVALGGQTGIGGSGGAGALGGAGGAESSSSGFGGFPQEGPVMLDAGPGPTPDAGSDGSFPIETAAP